MESYNQCMYLAFDWKTSPLICFLHRKPFTTITSATFRMPKPPVGNLRWAPSQPQLVNSTVVNDSQTGVVCLQGTARWEIGRTLSSTPMSSAKAVSPPSRMTCRPASTSLRLFLLWIRAPVKNACSLMLSCPSMFAMKRSKIPQELRSLSGSTGAVPSPGQRNHKAIRPV
jgi:hypothetical protein